MKTFEINDELENKLEEIRQNLELDSVQDVISLSIDMINLINKVHKEEGSLLIKNKHGNTLPLTLKEESKDKPTKKTTRKKRKK